MNNVINSNPTYHQKISHKKYEVRWKFWHFYYHSQFSHDPEALSNLDNNHQSHRQPSNTLWNNRSRVPTIEPLHARDSQRLVHHYPGNHTNDCLTIYATRIQHNHLIELRAPPGFQATRQHITHDWIHLMDKNLTVYFFMIFVIL